MINKITLYFYLVFVVLYFWSGVTKASPVIEWSAQHANPVLEYSRIDIPSDCSGRWFDNQVDLPPGGQLDLADWFKPGTVWKMRVREGDTMSHTICVIIGERHFYYLGINSTLEF